ncbi:MAG: Nramp family divalent metal transporter [Lachnospiraceae bacterium]|nr:Nramp family divalent metal transporter [Candidatus Equihabitans merdae]
MSNLGKRLKNVGPGALVAAAFIGPGTVTSCALSGANYGYTLLWAMLLSVISVIIMQSMAARLGIASKMGLGEALRTKFTSKGARVLIAILVIAAVFIGNIAYETGNVSGSIMGVQAAIPALANSKIVLAIVIGVVAFALLFSGSYKYVEKFLTALVVLMGVVFLVCAFASAPNWGEVFKGLFGFQAPDGSSWMTIAALMGTTVVPYNIYLHASSSAAKWADTNDVDEAIASSRLDCIISIGLGGLISMAIIICAGATMHAQGIEIASGAEMATSLQPLLGSWATVFFGIGLFAAGISSAITAPLSAAYASSGILGWGENMKSGKFKAFWIIVLAFGVIATCTLGASPTQIILFAQAANAFLLPITGILLLIVANDKKIMGKFANKTWYNVLVVLVICLFLFIAARNMTAFVTSLQALIAG